LASGAPCCGRQRMAFRPLQRVLGCSKFWVNSRSYRQMAEGTPDVDVVGNLKAVQDRMVAAAGGAPLPRLVAVSKTKPVELLQAAYDCGQRYFGENYVQELVEKSPLMPDDVQWHFIGHLQSNKANQLVRGCPNLQCMETIDTIKLANTVNKAWEAAERGRRLRVMVQVNTSGEESKSGCAPGDAAEVAAHIAQNCPGLEFGGLMTIGMPDYSGCRAEDFLSLKAARDQCAEAVGVDPATLELSMGMSSDFEAAIQNGSNSVRVGSTIFGARVYNK